MNLNNIDFSSPWSILLRRDFWGKKLILTGYFLLLILKPIFDLMGFAIFLALGKKNTQECLKTY